MNLRKPAKVIIKNYKSQIREMKFARKRLAQSGNSATMFKGHIVTVEMLDAAIAECYDALNGWKDFIKRGGKI